MDFFERRALINNLLERIARDSEKNYRPIMEVLTTYVRMHTPVMEKTDFEGSGSNDATPRSNNANPPHNVPAAAPSPDIQAILTVIGRRELKFEKGTIEPLDLHNTNLARANLFDADLGGAYLMGARLFVADLRSADLEGADLGFAQLKFGNLNGANLNGLDLSEADGLTQNQIDSALGDEKTKLPPGIHMPDKWKKSPNPTQLTK